MLGYISPSGAPDRALRGVSGELVCKHQRARLLYKALQEDGDSPREAAHFSHFIRGLGESTKVDVRKLSRVSPPQQRTSSGLLPSIKAGPPKNLGGEQ